MELEQIQVWQARLLVHGNDKKEATCDPEGEGVLGSGLWQAPSTVRLAHRICKARLQRMLALSHFL